MRIKLTNSYKNAGVDYMEVRDFAVSAYESRDPYKKGSAEFWYFCSGQFFSYSGFGYKFTNKEDVVKLIEDIYYAEADGKVIYDLDARIKELDIKIGYCE